MRMSDRKRTTAMTGSDGNAIEGKHIGHSLEHATHAILVKNSFNPVYSDILV